jgi:excisionase family DNA binding protein
VKEREDRARAAGEFSALLSAATADGLLVAQRPEFLDAREAAQLLGVSSSTFKDYVRAELPAIKIGRRIVFERKDVERWARERKTDGLFVSPKEMAVRRISCASDMEAAASKNQRVAQIREKLLKKPRASTRT